MQAQVAGLYRGTPQDSKPVGVLIVRPHPSEIHIPDKKKSAKEAKDITIKVSNSIKHLPDEYMKVMARVTSTLSSKVGKENTVLLYDTLSDISLEIKRLQEMRYKLPFPISQLDYTQMWPRENNSSNLMRYAGKIALFCHAYQTTMDKGVMYSSMEVGLIWPSDSAGKDDSMPPNLMVSFHPVRINKSGDRIYMTRNCARRIVTGRRGLWFIQRTDNMVQTSLRPDKPMKDKVNLSVIPKCAKDTAGEFAKEDEEGDNTTPNIAFSVPIWEDITKHVTKASANGLEIVQVLCSHARLDPEPDPVPIADFTVGAGRMRKKRKKEEIYEDEEEEVEEEFGYAAGSIPRVPQVAASYGRRY